jgi:hypothetical protein
MPSQPPQPRLITQPPAGTPVVQSLSELQALVKPSAPPRPVSQPPAPPVAQPPAPPVAQPPAASPSVAEAPLVSPSGHPPPSSPPEPLPNAELLFQRSEDPSPASPLTYREAAWAVPEGTSIATAVRLLAGMFEGVRAALAGVKPGKLVYMAIFDHRFVGKPTRPPLATLTWKDWKDQGQGPEIRRQGEPRTSFQPPPMAVSDSFIPAAVPQPAARVSAPPPAPLPSGPVSASAAPAPSADASVAQPVSAPAAPMAPISVHPHPVAITPLPVPIPSAPPPAAVVSDAGVMGIAPPVAGPPAADIAAGAAIIAPLPVAEVPASAASFPVASTASAAPVAVVSAPAPVAVPLGSVPVPPPASSSAAPAAVSAPPISAAIPSAPTTVAPAPALEAPAEASPSASVVIAADPAVAVAEPAPQLIVVPEAAPVIPVTTPVAPSRAPAPSVPSVRQSGVDLIADLFECMHDLHFLPDALAGADFVLALMLDKLPSAAALVHFYDIDSREFVVVRAYGAGATKAMQVRTNEKEPLVAEAMGKRRAVVLDNAAGDMRAQNGRWSLVGDPPRSLICAPVEQGGRFLGLLELSNPIDGQPFREGDGHAVTYIGEQFAEFLAERGVILDPERIGD